MNFKPFDFQFMHIRIVDEKRKKKRSTYMKENIYFRSPPQESLV